MRLTLAFFFFVIQYKRSCVTRCIGRMIEKPFYFYVRYNKLRRKNTSAKTYRRTLDSTGDNGLRDVISVRKILGEASSISIGRPTCVRGPVCRVTPSPSVGFLLARRPDKEMLGLLFLYFFFFFPFGGREKDNTPQSRASPVSTSTARRAIGLCTK